MSAEGVELLAHVGIEPDQVGRFVGGDFGLGFVDQKLGGCSEGAFGRFACGLGFGVHVIVAPCCGREFRLSRNR